MGGLPPKRATPSACLLSTVDSHGNIISIFCGYGDNLTAKTFR